MASLDEVYRKFGETSEAAQLLETEIGNVLLANQISIENFVENPDALLARKILDAINKSTLGQAIKKLGSSITTPDDLEGLLKSALKERNRLTHHFFREHNLRRFSHEGRQAMLEDLEGVHSCIFDAYRAVLMLSGFELDSLPLEMPMPTTHLPI